MGGGHFLHVAHITSTHPATDSRIFQRECLSLNQAGYVVDVVARNVASGTRDGIRFVPFPDLSRVRVVLEPWRVARYLVSNSDADIYHLHDPDLLPTAFVLRLIGRRVVYDCHEWYQAVMPHKGYPIAFARLVGIMLGTVENLVLPRLNGIVTPTDELTAICIRLNPETITLRNFPPLRTLAVVPVVEKRYDLIHVGTVTEARLLTMLDIAQALARQMSRRIRFCILGISPGLEQKMREREWLGVDVDMVERVPETEVPSFIGAARIGLNYHPYQPRFMVAIPTKILEYMSLGIPFVSSALPPLNSLLAGCNCGFLVHDNTTESFVRVIKILLDQPQVAHQMGGAGRALIQARLNWDSEFGRLTELYSRIMTGENDDDAKTDNQR